MVQKMSLFLNVNKQIDILNNQELPSDPTLPIVMISKQRMTSCWGTQILFESRLTKELADRWPRKKGCSYLQWRIVSFCKPPPFIWNLLDHDVLNSNLNLKPPAWGRFLLGSLVTIPWSTVEQKMQPSKLVVCNSFLVYTQADSKKNQGQRWTWKNWIDQNLTRKQHQIVGVLTELFNPKSKKQWWN